jgi:antitoxin HicB
MDNHYSLVIEWSDEDQAYIVSFPEWGVRLHTHGDTYEEAVQKAQELLDLVIEDAVEDGTTMPVARRFHSKEPSTL